MIPGQPLETFSITSLPTGNSSCVMVSCTLAIRPGGLAQLPNFKSRPRWRLGPIGERVAEHARRLALQDLPAPPRLTLRPVALDLGTDAQIGFIAPARAWTKCTPALDPKLGVEYTRPSTELVVDFLLN